MFDDPNPARASDVNDPRQDQVRIGARPPHFKVLLSNADFVDSPGWHVNFGSQECFYLDGINQALRLFTRSSTSFLKESGFVDRAVKEPSTKEWSRQSGDPLVPVSLPRIRTLKEGRPQSFGMCVLSIVAFELALKDLVTDIDPMWVYDFLRIRPAVYNIHRFDADKLTMLGAQYAGIRPRLLEASGQDKDELLTALTTGKTVTGPTARAIKAYIDTHCTLDPLHGVGEVRPTPGRNSGLGVGPAFEDEIIQSFSAPIQSGQGASTAG